MIGRVLLTLTALAVTGFVLLVLIGLWDRYEKETAALGPRNDTGNCIFCPAAAARFRGLCHDHRQGRRR